MAAVLQPRLQGALLTHSLLGQMLEGGFGVSKDADGEVLDVGRPLGSQLEELDVIPLHPVDENWGDRGISPPSQAPRPKAPAQSQLGQALSGGGLRLEGNGDSPGHTLGASGEAQDWLATPHHSAPGTFHWVGR